MHPLIRRLACVSALALAANLCLAESTAPTAPSAPAAPAASAPAGGPVLGTVGSLAGNLLSVTVAGAPTPGEAARSFFLTATTRITVAGAPGSTTDIVPGAQVAITVVDGSVTAVDVVSKPAVKADKKAKKEGKKAKKGKAGAAP